MKTPFLIIPVLALGLVAFPALAADSFNFNQGGQNAPENLTPDDDEEMIVPPATAPVTSAPLGAGQASQLHTPPMNSMQLAPTDAQMRIGALETQIRNMNGVIEKLQFSNQQLQQQLQRMGSDQEIRFQNIEKRVTEHDAAIKAAATAPATAATTPAPAAPAAETAEAAKAEAEKKETAATDVPPAKPEEGSKTLGTITRSEKGKGAEASPDAQKLYDDAFAALRQAHYDDAEAKFKSFLKGNPKHKLTENAKYWLAETYYARGKFSESAVAFAETYQAFPQGTKAPDNLLKMAMSLGSLGKKQDACLTLAELKKRFPSASSVIRNRAEQEHKSLGCS